MGEVEEFLEEFEVERVFIVAREAQHDLTAALALVSERAPRGIERCEGAEDE